MTPNETPSKFERQLDARHMQIFEELAAQSAHHWWQDLLSLWCPSGVEAGDFGLRLAIRNGYVNFYRLGQSIARVEIDSKGPMATTHIKYVCDEQDQSVGSEYVTLRDDWILRAGKQWRPYRGLDDVKKWIHAVNNKPKPNDKNGYAGKEKIFVDEVVAANPNIIDLEMGLPAWREPKRALRIDLVEIAAASAGCSVVFWEAKLTSDGPDCAKTLFLVRDPKFGSSSGHGITHQVHARLDVFEICVSVFLIRRCLLALTRLYWALNSPVKRPLRPSSPPSRLAAPISKASA